MNFTEFSFLKSTFYEYLCAREMLKMENWLWHDLSFLIGTRVLLLCKNLLKIISSPDSKTKGQKGSIFFWDPAGIVHMNVFLSCWLKIISCFDFTKCRVNGLLSLIDDFVFLNLIFFVYVINSFYFKFSSLLFFDCVLSNVWEAHPSLSFFFGLFKSCLGKRLFCSNIFMFCGRQKLFRWCSIMNSTSFMACLWIEGIWQLLHVVCRKVSFFAVFNRGENKLLPGSLHLNLDGDEFEVIFWALIVKCALFSDGDDNQ